LVTRFKQAEFRFLESRLDRVPAGAARRDRGWLERRAAGKGAPVFGAAERTLAGEHRCGTYLSRDGRFRRNHEANVNPAGGLRAKKEEGGLLRGKKP